MWSTEGSSNCLPGFASTLQTHSQMDMWDESKGISKHSIWRARLIVHNRLLCVWSAINSMYCVWVFNPSANDTSCPMKFKIIPPSQRCSIVVLRRVFARGLVVVSGGDPLLVMWSTAGCTVAPMDTFCKCIIPKTHRQKRQDLPQWPQSTGNVYILLSFFFFYKRIEKVISSIRRRGVKQYSATRSTQDQQNVPR